MTERDTRLFNPIRRQGARASVRVIPEALNPASFALDPAREPHLALHGPARAHRSGDGKSRACPGRGRAISTTIAGASLWKDGFPHLALVARAYEIEGAVVCYEGERGDGSVFASAIRFDREGFPEEVDLPPIASLPRSRWQIARSARSEIGRAKVRKTWEDTPFYARSELATKLYGEEVVAVQESLDMRRFASPVVQFMLPFRMPRKSAGKSVF